MNTRRIGLCARWLLTALLATALAGCATSGGRSYDDTKVAMIKRGQTTEAELLQWFGPPVFRNAPADGHTVLAWGFGRESHGGLSQTGSLTVSLGADGTVKEYSARTGPK